MTSPRRRPGDLSSKSQQAQLERIYKRYQATCQICFLFCTRDDASREHVIPLCRGGTSEDDNVILAHKECNAARDYIAKAIVGCIRRQRAGVPALAVRKNPGSFAPFSNLEDKPK